MPTIYEFSPNALSVLLFGDERLEGISPASKALGDTAKVLVIHRSLGTLIQKGDPEETTFHIEHCAAGGKMWSEVWLAYEWADSNAKRNKTRQASFDNRSQSTKKKERQTLIAGKLLALGLGKGNANYVTKLSADILANWKNGKSSEVLKLLNLTEDLNRFEQEDRNESK